MSIFHFVCSCVQPDPGRAPSGGHPGCSDQALPGHEQRRISLHLRKHTILFFESLSVIFTGLEQEGGAGGLESVSAARGEVQPGQSLFNHKG